MLSFFLNAFAFVIIELVVYYVVFKFLARKFLLPDDETPDDVNVLDLYKGMLERAVLTLGLAQGYPQILTLFAALKIGTRIKSEADTQAYNNYYLTGNLVSIALAIMYYKFLFARGDLLQLVQQILN